jgi:type III pantothenate kinase
MNLENKTKHNDILLLDIGNTNLKWTWLQDGNLGEITTVCHKGQEIAHLAAGEWSTISTPGDVYISSVALQSMEQSLADWMDQQWGLEPKFIRSSTQACGVTNSYAEPERLGVDRWLSMIALHAKLPGPTSVVDCGSAVTIDAIGLNGQHLGGLILPGFGMMHQSLVEHTSLVFESQVKSDGMLATDTETAIAAGGVLAVAALVEQIQQEVAAELDAAVDLVLTGGDAEVLQQALRIPCRIERNLVMQGLVEIIEDGVD